MTGIARHAFSGLIMLNQVAFAAIWLAVIGLTWPSVGLWWLLATPLWAMQGVVCGVTLVAVNSDG